MIIGRWTGIHTVVQAAWLISQLQGPMRVMLLWRWRMRRHASESNNLQHWERQEQQRRAAGRSEGWTFVVNRELRFNHIARCPNPLWRESQGSLRASSADFTHTSSLAWMWSLFFTRQAIHSKPKCSLTWQDLFTLECCDVVLSKYNACV